MIARSLLSFFLALSLPTWVAGAIYKRIAPDGSVYYSDQPEPGAKEVDLPEPTTYSPPPLPKSLLGSRKKKAAKLTPKKAHAYKTLEIVSPKNEATLRANDGSVPVTLRIDPPLQKGDVIRLLLDGRRLPLAIDAPSLVLKNVDRGSHTLEARIESQTGKVLIHGGPVSFHLRRESILMPNRRASPPRPAPK